MLFQPFPPQFVEDFLGRLAGVIRRRIGRQLRAPYYLLGRRWIPGLLFSEDRHRDLFLRIADRLRSEFGAIVVEEFGGHRDEDKEYWTLQMAGAQLLFMRT